MYLLQTILFYIIMVLQHICNRHVHIYIYTSICICIQFIYIYTLYYVHIRDGLLVGSARCCRTRKFNCRVYFSALLVHCMSSSSSSSAARAEAIEFSETRLAEGGGKGPPPTIYPFRTIGSRGGRGLYSVHSHVHV